MDRKYQPQVSNSETGNGRTESYDRSLWLLIPVNFYLWWKIVDYIDLYYWSFFNSTTYELIVLSINIPVYFSAVFYVFKIRVLPNIFWKIWIVIAVLDELRLAIDYIEKVDFYSGLIYVVFFVGPVVPLYVIGVIYAYLSPTIWKDVDVNNTKNE
ncbi:MULTISPECIES: hypothetical protein [unclassified Pseudoalteromonas]|uniref:hypothetical protein n=1 Tax=unclassified Pseudoalteromonas TaxID=194690 RepID=UPI0020982EBC|nr:hypothetical protein [Pseudoalteromonas sp. XMcav2-N]MCO7191241.1 hypothetical protein [Pseudoalteromonas sp. XMcav2-N]